jgi:hypothetical protein
MTLYKKISPLNNGWYKTLLKINDKNDKFLLYWIISSFIPRMASKNSLCAQPHPFARAIFFNRLIGIFRTAWIKPATAKRAAKNPVVRRKAFLVYPDD